jgi:hypothetical protein
MPNKTQTEVIFCAIDGCDAPAKYKTSSGMPLCTSHAEAYELAKLTSWGRIIRTHWKILSKT